MGTITIQGSKEDTAIFQGMIKAAESSSVFRNALYQISMNPSTDQPITVILKGGPHFNFVDTFTTNAVYVKDIEQLPISVKPGNDARTRAEVILHFLEERWYRAKYIDNNFLDAFQYALGPDNELRKQYGQSPIDVAATVSNRANPISILNTNIYVFDDGATWNVIRRDGRFKIIITPATKSQTPPSKGPFNIFWILGPLLSDAYVGVAFPPANVAEFSASNKNGPDSNPNDFTAIIDWGDGTTSVGQVVHYEEQGYVYPYDFVVMGSHAYAQAGDFPIHVQIVDAKWYSEQDAVVNDVGVSDWSSISWVQGPQVPESTAGVGFTDAVIAQFLASWDGQPDSEPGDFQPIITWGDGSTSTGEIEPAGGAGDPSNEYIVLASHTYQQAGAWPIQIQITDTTSYTQDDTTDTYANVQG